MNRESPLGHDDPEGIRSRIWARTFPEQVPTTLPRRTSSYERSTLPHPKPGQSRAATPLDHPAPSRRPSARGGTPHAPAAERRRRGSCALGGDSYVPKCARIQRPRSRATSGPVPMTRSAKSAVRTSRGWVHQPATAPARAGAATSGSPSARLVQSASVATHGA